MKITYPTDGSTVQVTRTWVIAWEDVVSTDPQYVDFWLTHERSPPEYTPRLLYGKVDVHQMAHLEISASVGSTIQADKGYAIWAMAEGSNPSSPDKHLIAESQPFNIITEKKHEL